MESKTANRQRLVSEDEQRRQREQSRRMNEAALADERGPETKDVEGEVKSSSPATAAAVHLLALSEEEELAVQLSAVAVTDISVRQDSGGVYTVYKVETTRSDRDEPVAVWHRYSDFVALHEQLLASMETSAQRSQFSNVAALPGKKWFGNMDPSFVAERRRQLNDYVGRLVMYPGLTQNFALRSFLQPSLRHDWPNRFGPINLTLHDLPHESSVTEWWYINSHVKTSTGKDLSLFVCFFRIVKHVDPKSGRKSYAHALNWAITDVETGEYHCDVLIDQDSPQMILKQMNSGSRAIADEKLRAAMKEVLAKGNVPRPDRMFNRNPKVSKSSLNLDFEDAQFFKDESGAYVVTARHAEQKGTGLRLRFVPQKPAVRHGANGVVLGHDGDDMFYYFIPRCSVSGDVSIKGTNHPISSGAAWYDHEFGGILPEEGESRMDYAWNWAAIQLDNQYEITAAVLVNPRDDSIMETRTVVVDPAGRRKQYSDMTMEATGKPWTSCRTFRTYPVSWLLRIPEAGIELQLEATVKDQEFMTLIAKPAFWEGRCEVSGKFGDSQVGGLCFIERNGFDEMPKLMDFFKSVGKQVRKSVNHMYPDEPTKEQVRDLIANKDTEYYCKGVPPQILQQTLLAPVRLIADRGGKSWRSYGALACCDVVGGDSRQFVEWLAMPEFMHVGSLIVDDIQDVSQERRGGPCAHLVYGEPLCINAGTAAYFMCEHLIKAPGLSAETLNKVYQLYFACLRGGHAGQALDIYGLDYLMPQAIEEGSSDLLEERSLAIHMLKTAVPAGTLARMGALVGGGTDEQVEAVGRYFESVGLAFQIMDDVLNLRGLFFGKADLGGEDKAKQKKSLKTLGEDIMCGKVTMPVAKAMSRISNKQDRTELWDVIKSKPQNPSVVAEVIQKLEACGAIDACVEHADRLVEEAWAHLDSRVPDSFQKMMLRSFGWFVVRR